MSKTSKGYKGGLHSNREIKTLGMIQDAHGMTITNNTSKTTSKGPQILEKAMLAPRHTSGPEKYQGSARSYFALTRLTQILLLFFGVKEIKNVLALRIRAEKGEVLNTKTTTFKIIVIELNLYCTK